MKLFQFVPTFQNFPSFNRKYRKANINSEDPRSYVLNSFRARNDIGDILTQTKEVEDEYPFFFDVIHIRQTKPPKKKDAF